MDLRANTVVWGCGLSSRYTRLAACSMLGWNFNYDLAKLSKSVCCQAGLAQRAVTRIEDGTPLKSDNEIQDEIDGAIDNGSTGFHRDLNALPKPLTASDLSRKDGDNSKVRVAYQGVPGSYSEDAALKAYPMCETVPCDEFEAAFKAVELWLVDRAVLPIENTLGGSIHRNYDLLLRHRLHIVGEVQLPINHCLLGLRGVRKEELKRVLSHPQALEHCNKKISEFGLMRISTKDTAGAAQIMATELKRDTGAIASARAAVIYGLDILEEKMQDENENITRYIVLAREPQIPGIGKYYKTSIVFSLEEGPGVLFKALAVFYLRNIVLTKIESRPQRKRPLRVVDDQNRGTARYFDYLFYIDFEASMAEPRAQFALGHLQEFSRFLRVLGCYPVYKVE